MRSSNQKSLDKAGRKEMKNSDGPQKKTSGETGSKP